MPTPQGLWTPPRTATLVVAASDSSDKSKVQADYVCDAVNDQVEIQAAIDALPTAGGKVYLSEGNFTIDASIVIPYDKRMVLEGSGPGTVLETDDNIDIIYTTPTPGFDYTADKGTTLRDFKMVSTAVAVPHNGINLDHRHGVLVDDIWAEGDWLIAVNGTFVNNSTIRGLNALGCYEGIHLDSDLDDVLISDCDISYSKNFGIHLISGKYMNIVNNKVEESELAALYLASTNESTVVGNKFRQSYNGDGILMEGIGCCRNSIVGNAITDNGSGAPGTYAGIKLTTDAYHNIITGNTIMGPVNHIYGIWVHFSAGVDNEIYDNCIYNNLTPYRDDATQTIPRIPRPLRDNGVEIVVPNLGWTEAVNGGGTVTQNRTYTLHSIMNAVGAAADARIYTEVQGLNPGASEGRIDWDKELFLQFTVNRNNSEVAQSPTSYVQLKDTSAIGALAADGIGIKILNLTLYGVSWGVASGAEQAIDLSITMTTAYQYTIGIHHVPGKWDKWYVNGILKGIQANANHVPGGGSAANAYLVSSVSTPGKPTANVYYFTSSFVIWHLTI